MRFYQNEVTWANQAGFVKTVEQIELLEEQAFVNGMLTIKEEAKKGIWINEGIYGVSQVKSLIEKAVAEHDAAIKQSLKRMGVDILKALSDDEEMIEKGGTR